MSDRRAADGGGRNRLADETSAYLRQHMDNPVDWYPWGPEAFARAQAESKPVLVSIGYSACHWCHVMAHESFEHEPTAELMNELFVNIKVDREERPDVDQIYMDTVVRLTGHGGWPLTVFCTSDGRPFYAGTYYSREPRGQGPTFRQILTAVHDAWKKRPDEVEQNAAQILAALEDRPQGEARGASGVELLRAGASSILQSADLEHGGFGGAPKFPTPTNLALLLAAVDLLPEPDAERALQHCLHSTEEMARRGLYDHLGGGFHRYCVDATWTIPHFEKMLYDQGLLLQIYAEAIRRSGREELEWPVRETVAYLRREMTAPEGGFYASQDADSEGEEGRFYVWTPAQLREVLGEDAEAFAHAYGVGEGGNFEHGTTHLVDRARGPRALFAASREKLLAERSRRVPPGTDTKRVTSWNGYTIAGLARAASALEDETILDDATRAADFVFDEMTDRDGRLLRVFAEGRAHVTAFLDDHAAMIEACLELHRAGADASYLERALQLGHEVCERFYDADAGDLFLTPADGEPLVHRPRSDNDGATPQATGHALLGLLRLAELCGSDELGRVARRVLDTHAYVLERIPHAFPSLLRAAALAERGVSVAVVVGEAQSDGARALLARARLALGPEDAVVAVAPGGPRPAAVAASWIEGREAEGGRATAYVCRGTSCSLPIRDPKGFDELDEPS
jgi:uncharacterized protein YyaL (SSP411 family)